MEFQQSIFRLSTKENPATLPEQVFQNMDFDFLCTVGGHLVENSDQFNCLMNVLKEIGEQDFFVVENLGLIDSARLTPFKAQFSVESNLQDFDKILWEFDGAFGMLPHSFFVHGRSMEWGIYIAEYPTLLVIGCVSRLAEKFRVVYGIIGNGYDQQKDFIRQEFSCSQNKDMERAFLINYRLA